MAPNLGDRLELAFFNYTTYINKTKLIFFTPPLTSKKENKDHIVFNGMKSFTEMTALQRHAVKTAFFQSS